MSDVAIMYLRRSSDKQEDSTEQQRCLNEEYIQKQGYRLHARLGIWEETGSGRSFEERTVFQAMLRAVQAGEVGAQVLVMYRPNRFGRSVDLPEFYHYEFLFQKAGVRIEYASGSEYNIAGVGGHFTRAIAYMQAGEYSKNLSNDSTRGLLANARAGFATGGEPVLGYDRMLVDRDGNELTVLQRGIRKSDDQTLKVKYVPTTDERVRNFVVEEIFRRPYRMEWSPARTAKHLNALIRTGEGLPATRMGREMRRRDGRTVKYSGKWASATIEAMWMSYTYIGWRTLVIEADNEFRGEKVVCKDAHEPLIDEETFWGLFERTRQRPWNVRKLGPHRRREPGRYPLSGLGTCVHCGGGLAGSKSSNLQKGRTTLYYRDSGDTNGSCKAPRWCIPTDTLESWVRERIAERLQSAPFQEALLAMLCQRLAPEAVSDAQGALSRLREVEKSIERLLDLVSNNSVPSEALGKRLDSLEIEKRRLQEATAGTQARPVVPAPELERIAGEVTQRALEALQGNNEVLAEIARHFIQSMSVDKLKRRIDVIFYEVPRLNAVLGASSGSCIGEVELMGLEPTTSRMPCSGNWPRSASERRLATCPALLGTRWARTDERRELNQCPRGLGKDDSQKLPLRLRRWRGQARGDRGPRGRVDGSAVFRRSRLPHGRRRAFGREHRAVPLDRGAQGEPRCAVAR
jgi:DNA invertase Pin-like site-specific DNA recombinase